MQKILFIAPHLSTGGMPQYLYKEMESINNDFEVYCIEWDDITGGQLVIQRNRIQKLLGNKLITLGENKYKLFDYINEIKPDIIHLQEIPEHFIPYDVAKRLYLENRPYIIIETSHDSSGDPNKKLFFPDKFMFVSKWQIEQYKSLEIPSVLVEYPIEYVTRTKTREELLKSLNLDPNKKHIINVGLFTPRKNQAEVIEYARMLENYPIQFHFIGNQADNFKYYWEPLMKNFPKNCKWWGERNDVENFYQMADLMLFTSRGTNNDKETSPLVIREAISNRTPSLIYNLPVYLGMYDNYDNLKFLNFDNKQENVNKILQELNLNPIKIIESEYIEVKTDNTEHFYYETTKGKEDLLSYSYTRSCQDALEQYGDGAAQYWSIFLYHEMDTDFIKIEPGDVFFDLGANIGMSSKYALLHGASEVHCFEPDSNLHMLIRKNIPQAFIYDNAISNEEKEIELYHWPYNPINVGPKYKCNTINLKTVLKVPNKPIDYMKIDIEGFEEHLFDDLSIPELSNVHKLFIECHFKPTDKFCQTLKDKGFDLEINDGGLQTFVYAKNKHFRELFDIENDHEIQIIPSQSNTNKKIHIIDAYAITEDKLTILRKCIESVKKMGGDIMLVSHCSFPEDIIKSVNYYIFDSDNRFNDNNVFGYQLGENIKIEKNIYKSHEFTIVKSMRNAMNMAHQLNYEYFQFTEFDHIYSNIDIVEISRLEEKMMTEDKNFLFFMPPTAQFGNIVGKFYDTCFFMGSIKKFIDKFNNFFPLTIEEYNKTLAKMFPNCLEHFFYQMFKDENSLIINDYVKSYFKSSDINLSSWASSQVDIYIDNNNLPYLVVNNRDAIKHRYIIGINGEVKTVDLFYDFNITPLTKNSDIYVEIFYDGVLIDTKYLTYDENKHNEYKLIGAIEINDKTKIDLPAQYEKPKERLFFSEFNDPDNKITITYLGKTYKKILISIKDIDSKTCIYSTNWDAVPGSICWVTPLPKNVIDFYNDQKFGGFLIEFREKNNLIETEEIRFRTLPYTKVVMDLSDTEPIFSNYREFFDYRIYDTFDIQNRDVVFDIGANIGLWTAYILSQGAKKVYSFEPNKAAVNQLEINFGDNENVVIVPNGIYDKHTRIPFYIDDGNSLISSIIEDPNKKPSYEIDTLTIKEVLSNFNIDKVDLVKMDIEGAEFDIIENIDNETIQKIDSFLIEYHDFYFGNGIEKVMKLINQLENFGYKVTRGPIGKFIFAKR